MTNYNYQFLLHSDEPMMLEQEETAKAFCRKKLQLFFDSIEVDIEDRYWICNIPNLSDMGDDAHWMRRAKNLLTVEGLPLPFTSYNYVLQIIWDAFFVREEEQDRWTASHPLYPALHQLSKTPVKFEDECWLNVDWSELFQHPPKQDIRTDHRYEVSCAQWIKRSNQHIIDADEIVFDGISDMMTDLVAHQYHPNTPAFRERVLDENMDGSVQELDPSRVTSGTLDTRLITEGRETDEQQ